jgi:hypothetical protein
MTYRERRLARAERLRGWAETREAKQAGLNEAARADEAATGIPFGQPILVGHHSERRHRNAIARIDRAMGAAVENSRKADSMRGRADSIEAAAEHAIYSDDEDAIERLTEKLATLEAKREQIKADNAAFRKSHKAELKGMTAYERDQAMPHRGYELRNLGGVISNTRKRIEHLTREAAAIERGDRGYGRQMAARYGGECADCGSKIERGDTMTYYRRTRECVCGTCTAKGEE